MAYDYIERAYGMRFNPGMRVRFSEYGDLPGVVKRVKGDPHYVTIKFDNGRTGLCHPSSLTITEKSGG